MRIIKYFIVAVILIILSPIKVNAACSYERVAELSRIAGNVQLSYTYNVENNKIKYIVTLNNLTNDIYIIDQDKKVIRGVGEISFTSNASQNLRFTFYSNDSMCPKEKLLSKNLVLPYYNRRFVTSECKKNPGFAYCQLWFNSKSITNAEFKKSLNKYLTQEAVKNETTSKIDLTGFFEDNLLWICLSIIALIILIALTFVKRSIL